MTDFPRPSDRSGSHPGNHPGDRPNGPYDEDARLRRLIDDAVSDVEPRDSLDAIKARTAVTSLRSRRPWLLGAAAAAVATAATVTGIAVLADDPALTGRNEPGVAAGPATTDPEPTLDEPTTDPAPGTDEPTAVPGAETTVPVYYVGETSRGPRLYREFRTVTTTDEQRATAAARTALEAPLDPDYRSGWPAGVEVRSVDLTGDVATVDLGSGGDPASLRQRPDGMTEEQAAIALEQMVYTVQAALQQGRPGVQLLIDGERTDMVLGQPASEPLSQGSPDQVLGQVWIIDPGESAEVGSPFTVTGLAAAFEANVQWELVQGGTVVESGFTTAEECCTMAPYEFTVEAPPGEYTLVVHDEDPSGGMEGFAPWQDTKRITVR